MSICPSDDIHSVYLDNELPENFKVEYEAHLQTCEACQKKLEQLKKLHSLFEEDSKSISPDEHYLDESFDRLMVKMSYSKNTGKAKDNSKKYQNIGVVSVAAAAVLAFAIVLPVSLERGQKNRHEPQNPSVAAISAPTLANNVGLNSGRSVVISGNIDRQALASVNSEPAYGNFVQNVSSNNMPNGIPGGKPDGGPGMDGKPPRPMDDMMNDMRMARFDVFRPEFEEKPNNLSITVPGVEEVMNRP